MNDTSTDPQRLRDEPPFDRATGYSGQDYSIEQERAAAERPVAPAAAPADGRDLPPDAGQPAGFDEAAGEVHGAGSGIGGGNGGEDFGEYSPSGDMYPLTGGEGTDHRPGDLGPAHGDER